jgi:hypothetical protein
MNFTKRVTLFGVGVVIGSIVMYFLVLKKRNIFKTPTTIITEKIIKHPMGVSLKTDCLLKCNNISNDEIKNLLQENAEIDFGDSQVHKKPCKVYIINNKNINSNLSQCTFEICDSSSILIDARIKNMANCFCDSIKQ